MLENIQAKIFNMIEISADLWRLPSLVKCIPTNGVVSGKGELVMGAGVALEYRKRYPDSSAPKALAAHVVGNGNTPAFMDRIDGINYWSFPTKRGWRDSSEITLIAQSALKLKASLFEHYGAELQSGAHTVLLPRVGCGLGGLSWREVKGVLDTVFKEDLFVVCSPLNHRLDLPAVRAQQTGRGLRQSDSARSLQGSMNR